MTVHDDVMIPQYHQALSSVTWSGGYTDTDYSQMAQAALDTMALEIESNYLSYTVGSPITITGDSDFYGFPGLRFFDIRADA